MIDELSAICPDAHPAGVNFPDVMTGVLNPTALIVSVCGLVEIFAAARHLAANLVAVAKPLCLLQRPVGNPPAS